MKKMKFTLIILTALLALSVGCSKDEEETNERPTCEITAPHHGDEFKVGESVIITVKASDSDGSIAEVKIFIDKELKATLSAPPYEYNWDTQGEAARIVQLKAMAYDDKGKDEYHKITFSLIPASGPPEADFTATPNEGTAPLTVNFTDQSTNAPNTWHWDFGDGTSSNLQSPEHNYASPGYYTVTLEATNNYGSGNISKTDFIKAYTNEISGSIIDPRDGHVYKTIGIGIQTWFAENLNFETEKSWCYDNDPDNCEKYGRLYQWKTIMNGELASDEVPSGVQGICPAGWHIPSDAEWMILEMYIGMSKSEAYGINKWRGTDEGKKLKSVDGWNDNGNGTDAVGFAALSSGYLFNPDINGDELFYHQGEYGYWWTSKGDNVVDAYVRILGYNENRVHRTTKPLGFVYSVRCVKD
jgi:uncharacterized protein (TIGR02145 family)